MLRWMAEITYRDGSEPNIVEFEEIGTFQSDRYRKKISKLLKAGLWEGVAPEDRPTLNDIIEHGVHGDAADWHDIDQIVITLNRPVLNPEPETEPAPEPEPDPTPQGLEI